MAAIGVASRQKFPLAAFNNKNPFIFQCSVELDGTNDPTNGYGLSGVTVARSTTGEYTFTFPDAYPELIDFHCDLLNSTIPNAKAEFKSYSAGVLTVRVVKSADVPAVDLAAYETLAIASDTGTAPEAGHVIFVEDVGTTPVGRLTIIQGGAPATTQVRVEYSAGVPTFTTNSTDAVDSIKYLQVHSAGTVTAADAAVDLNGPRLSVQAVFQRKTTLSKTYT